MCCSRWKPGGNTHRVSMQTGAITPRHLPIVIKARNQNPGTAFSVLPKRIGNGGLMSGHSRLTRAAGSRSSSCFGGCWSHSTTCKCCPQAWQHDARSQYHTQLHADPTQLPHAQTCATCLINDIAPPPGPSAPGSSTCRVSITRCLAVGACRPRKAPAEPRLVSSTTPHVQLRMHAIRYSASFQDLGGHTTRCVPSEKAKPYCVVIGPKLTVSVLPCRLYRNSPRLQWSELHEVSPFGC
eukprot:3151000-Rhodomonas_salina.2